METSKTAPSFKIVAPIASGSAADAAGAFSLGRLVEQARSEYAKGNLQAVVDLLRPVVDAETETAASLPDSTASFASAATLVARAAFRTGDPVLSTRAAQRAVEALSRARVTTSASPADALNEAVVAFALAGQFERALAAMDDAVNARATTAESCLFAGIAASELQRDDAAVGFLRHAESIDADDLELRRLETLAGVLDRMGGDLAKEAADAQFEVGAVHYRADRYPDALGWFNKAIGRNPAHVKALAHKAETLRLIADPASRDEAIRAVETALRYQPNYAWAHAVHGEALWAVERLEDAAEAYARALELESRVAQWHYRLGSILRQLNRPDAALESFARALAHNPSPSVKRWALARRAELLVNAGRKQEALASYTEAVSVSPEIAESDSWILTGKAEVLRSLGRVAEADEFLKRALELTPDDLFAQTSLAQSLIDRYKDADALPILERVLQKDPTYASALQGKVLALFRLDQVTPALELVGRLIEMAPDSGWERALRGALLFQAEDYAGAVAAFKQATELTADIDWAQSGYSTSCLWLAPLSAPTERESLFKRAIAASGEAIRLSSDDLSYQSGLGEALWQSGRRADGEAQFRRVLTMAGSRSTLDYFGANETGWAAFRLATSHAADAQSLLGEAERLFIEALTQKHDRPWSCDALTTRFNLALVMLFSGRIALALREFDEAAVLLTHHELAMRRGVLGRAKARLAELLTESPQLPQLTYAKRAFEQLDAAYQATQSPPTSFSEGARPPA